MTPEQIKEIALRVAEDMLMQHTYDSCDYMEFSSLFATRFLAEVQKASEPVAWMYQERDGKPFVSTSPPSSFAPNELSENEVSIFPLYTNPPVSAVPSREEVG